MTGSYNGVARLWDATSGKQVRRFESKLRISSVALSSDGHYVLAEGGGGLQLWDATTGVGVFRADYPLYVTAAAISPDGLLVLAASDPFNAVHLWNIATSEEVLRLEAHSLTITSVACSPDDRYILTGSLDRTARLWDRKSGIKIRSFESDSEVDSVAFSPDGRFVVTGHEDKTARLWDLTSGKEIWRFEGHTAPIYSAAFSPDGRFVLQTASTRQHGCGIRRTAARYADSRASRRTTGSELSH